MSQGKIDESIWFLIYRYRFKKHKGWFVSFYFGEGKNAFRQSDYRILESTIFQVRIDESISFLACRYRFEKPKRWFVKF